MLHVRYLLIPVGLNTESTHLLDRGHIPIEQAKEVSGLISLADSPAEHDILDDLCARGCMGTVYWSIYEYTGVHNSATYHRHRAGSAGVEADDPGDKRATIPTAGNAEHNICTYRQIDVDWRTDHEHIVS